MQIRPSPGPPDAGVRAREPLSLHPMQGICIPCKRLARHAKFFHERRASFGGHARTASRGRTPLGWCAPAARVPVSRRVGTTGLSPRVRAADEVTVAKSSSPIRDAVLGELRDLVFRLSCVAGLIFGLLSALDSPAPPPSCARAEGCVGSVLAASMWPILGPALFGMLLGGLVGALLSRLIRSPRRRAVQLAGRWIRARYAGS